MNLYNLRLKELQNKADVFKSRINRLYAKSSRFSFYRLIIFALGTTLTITGFVADKSAGWTLLIISTAAFSVTVHLHNRLITGIKRFHTYLNIINENISRMKLSWDGIPEPPANKSPDDISTGKDLDLTGNRSLHQLTDVSVSEEGSLFLRNRLTNLIPDYRFIKESQKIIGELKNQTAFRERFLLKARLISKKHLQCGRITSWIENTADENLPGFILPLSFALTVIYVTLFILSVTVITPSVWLPFLMLYFLIYLSVSKKSGRIISECSDLENHIRKFSILIYTISGFKFRNSPALNSFLVNSFGDKSGDRDLYKAAEELRSLEKITSALLLRENPVLRILLNVLFPYDIYFCRKLVRLKSRLVKEIPVWLERFNELESYISLSGFAYLNPDYTFPEVAETGKSSFEALKLGHPLIKREEKICNDIAFRKENEILIITGSNMSGKSTFLKSIGINLCLAYSGAPVNAEFLKTSLYEIFTCIKVNDSVADGISYFYAEVKRLKQLLDELGNEKGLPVFFMIDEIFKGTNNRERLAGSRAFIKRLSELRCTGAVTTHDLELVNLSQEISKITNYHFREEIIDGKMKFDFQMHEGPCPTTNALRIMELSGLPVK